MAVVELRGWLGLPERAEDQGGGSSAALGTQGMRTTVGARIGWDNIGGGAVVHADMVLLICENPPAAECP